MTEVLAPDRWPTLIVVGGRFAGLMFVDPLWGMTNMPATLRSALVVLFTMAALPGIPNATLAPDYAGLVAPLASELMIGLAIGLTGAIFIAGVSLAGEVVSVQTGLNLSATITMNADDTVGGIAEIERRFATTIYVALGGHLILLSGVAHSLAVIPPGGALNLTTGGQAIMLLAGTVFTTAARVAAPILATLLIAHVVVAVLSKAVPQVPSYAVAFPITILLGFVTLVAVLPFLAEYVGEWVGTLPRSVADLVGAFAVR